MYYGATKSCKMIGAGIPRSRRRWDLGFAYFELVVGIAPSIIRRPVGYGLTRRANDMTVG